MGFNDNSLVRKTDVYVVRRSVYDWNRPWTTTCDGYGSEKKRRCPPTTSTTSGVHTWIDDPSYTPEYQIGSSPWTCFITPTGLPQKVSHWNVNLQWPVLSRRVVDGHVVYQTPSSDGEMKEGVLNSIYQLNGKWFDFLRDRSLEIEVWEYLNM